MKVKLYILLLGFALKEVVFCQSTVHSDQIQKILCEPLYLNDTKSKFWAGKYKMEMSQTGWQMSTLYASKEIFENEVPGNLEREAKIKNVHRSFSGLSLYKTGTVAPLGRFHRAIITHFIQGHSFTMHMFDCDNSMYTKVELGFHTQHYSVITKPGVWFAVDIEKHRNEDYTLAGWTIIHYGIDNNSYTLANRTKIIKKFPHHADLITRITL